MERGSNQPNKDSKSEKRLKHDHYSDVGGHCFRGSFIRHLKEMRQAFGVEMRFVPVTYDNVWTRRRQMRRISIDGKR